MVEVNSDNRAIIVDGDITISWYIAKREFNRNSSLDYAKIVKRGAEVKIGCDIGGAVLLGEIISRVQENLRGTNSKYEIFVPKINASVLPFNKFPSEFSVWSYNEKENVWRLSESFGSSISATELPKLDHQGKDIENPWGIILDDLNHAYRTNEDAWLKCIKNHSDSLNWAIIKLTHPFTSEESGNPLLEQLIENYSKRLYCIVSVHQLRLDNQKISYGLSWERTGFEVANSIRSHPILNKIGTVIVNP